MQNLKELQEEIGKQFGSGFGPETRKMPGDLRTLQNLMRDHEVHVMLVPEVHGIKIIAYGGSNKVIMKEINMCSPEPGLTKTCLDAVLEVL